MDGSVKKRLGQYFSGPKVAELLVEMVELGQETSAVDPMAGTGDMLFAVKQKGGAVKNLYGIEIDPMAGGLCSSRIPSGKIKVADAFCPETYDAIGRSSWDLVITNPPYVRYQSMESFDGQEFSLQNARDTRDSLIRTIHSFGHLNDSELACFIRIAQSYSGLSDLAVPAWILCASLVTLGGTLAMVVPESWLSREYALSIKYMLLKFFDIRYIVEDLNSVWFSDALVKTNLLVAKRVEYRPNFPFDTRAKYKRIRLETSCGDENSIVGKMRFSYNRGRTAYQSLLNVDYDVMGEGFSMNILPVSNIISEMLSSPAFAKLYPKLEQSNLPATTLSLPKDLYDVSGKEPRCSLCDLKAWGVSVGQGLRTGANRFFYGELEKSDDDSEQLLVDNLFAKRHISVKKSRTRPVLRYQADINCGLVVRSAALSHRLLYIQSALSGTDKELLKHIAEAEKIKILSAGKLTHFQNLSAVKPNVRNVLVDNHLVERSWYMLPPLMPRHTPALCISRVNYKEAKCLLIDDANIVVDANFSTLWMDNPKEKIIYAMFAVLNSSWIKAYLETISTVMGGGALKIEASHIRQILLPKPTNERIQRLSILGEKLRYADNDATNEIVREIDSYFLTQLYGEAFKQRDVNDLSEYLNQKIANRQR